MPGAVTIGDEAMETLYKFLQDDGSCTHSDARLRLPNGWPLPNGKRKGKWLPAIKGELEHCANGYHLATAAGLIEHCDQRLFIAEYDGEMVPGKTKIVVRRARLVREVPDWVKILRLWSADMAERAMAVAGTTDERLLVIPGLIRQSVLVGLSQSEIDTARQAADTAWQAAYTARQAAYTAWQAAYTARQAADTAWQDAYTARQTAYTARQAADTAWQAEMDYGNRRLLEYIEHGIAGVPALVLPERLVTRP